MNTDRETIRAMLSEYLDGELTPQQAAEVAAALAGDEELAREYAELQAMRQAVSSLRGATAPQDLADRIMHAAHHHVFSPHVGPQRGGAFGKFFHMQMIAAAAVVLVAVGMGMYVINSLSKSQEVAQTVAINDLPLPATSARSMPGDKNLKAAEAITKERSERFRNISAGRPAVHAMPAPTDGLSKSRPVKADALTRENLERLEGKMLAEESLDEEAAPDLKPIITPEPSMAMDRDASGFSRQPEEQEPASVAMPEKTEEKTALAMTPPVLRAPRPVLVMDDRQNAPGRKVRSFQSISEEKSVAGSAIIEVAAKPREMDFSRKDMPKIAMAVKAESEPTPAAPAIPADTETPELAAFEAPCVAPTAKPSTVAKIEGPAKKAKAACEGIDMKVPYTSTNQNIVIETPNVSETQVTLENCMKANNIQVVYVRQGDSFQARRLAINTQLQATYGSTDREPTTLQYNIRTSPQQASQLNADLTKNFPNARNLQTPSARLAAVETPADKKYGYNAMAPKSITNAADESPVSMVITIMKRPAIGAISAPAAATEPASAPASQPATQPATLPTK